MGFEKIKISLDYWDVIYHANQMENEADKLQRRITELRNIKNELRSDWEGPAASTFQGKLSELINNMVTTYNNMTYVIRLIRSTAKAIKDADDQAAENAAKLSN